MCKVIPTDFSGGAFAFYRPYDIVRDMTEAIEDRDSDFQIKAATEMVVFQPNNALIAKPRLREQDMKPQRIFFYKRLDDERIFAWTEQEASMMLKSNHAVLLRQIGCSDGNTYSNFIRNCGIKPGARIPRAEALKILEDAFNAEMAAAQGHFVNPDDQNVHFDNSYPLNQRSQFNPPA